MIDELLRSFYQHIASEEYDKALALINDAEGATEEPEKIVIQALKIKQHLQKYLSLGRP